MLANLQRVRSRRQPTAGYNDLDDWRFADMAPSLGGVGHRVRTRAELKAALDTAVAERGKFHLIEMMIERGTISRTLDRFVNAYAAQRAKG